MHINNEMKAYIVDTKRRKWLCFLPIDAGYAHRPCVLHHAMPHVLPCASNTHHAFNFNIAGIAWASKYHKEWIQTEFSSLDRFRFDRICISIIIWAKEKKKTTDWAFTFNAKYWIIWSSSFRMRFFLFFNRNKWTGFAKDEPHHAIHEKISRRRRTFFQGLRRGDETMSVCQHHFSSSHCCHYSMIRCRVLYK